MTPHARTIVDRRGAFAARQGERIDAIPSQAERDNAWADVQARIRRGEAVQARLRGPLTLSRLQSLGRGGRVVAIKDRRTA